MLLSAGIGTNIAIHFLDPLVIRIRSGVSFAALGDTMPIFTTRSAYHLQQRDLAIGVVVFCCNATNLMDGLDGLCGGVTAIMAGGFLFLAVYLAMRGGSGNTNCDALRVVLGLALLGGVLGFVPYNFNPASIFMGDTGSMFLGFSCATMIL